ncbi:MAG: phage tail protein [Roseovarius sp.]|nr:phage tail protein [Roseovarius sp.]
MGLFGKIFGIALIAVAVAATISTGGAAAPLAGTAFATFAATGLGQLLTLAAFTIGQTLAFAPGKFSSGLQTSTTVSGEDQPESFIVGTRYATAGAQTYPTLSFNKNRWLVNRIELSDLPGCEVIRFAVDGEWVEIDPLAVDELGLGVTGKYAGKLFITYFDGSQTTAAQMMLDKFGADPNYPYDASMINAGGCYAIVSARFDQELFPAQPAYRFELQGIPLYDPRADSSVGGSGAQRWADKTTWQPTGNPFVIIYNILRGITLRDGSIWGGGVAAEDLPLANWFAAMNDCDEQVQIGGGIGSRYLAGFEIKVDNEPGDVITEIAKAASGLITDVGGTWYARAGAPDLPVFNITDDVMLDFEPVGHNPHSGLEQTANALTVTYPDPSQIYEPRAAPIRTNAAWEAEDGQRLTREISLAAVPFPGRAQIIAKELHEDERRQSKHILALPRTMLSARPLQTVDFTSDHFGHDGKDFEISSVAVDLNTLNLQMIIREVNPADFTPPTIIDTTIATPVSAGPETLVVTGFAAVATPPSALSASALSASALAASALAASAPCAPSAPSALLK